MGDKVVGGMRGSLPKPALHTKPALYKGCPFPLEMEAEDLWCYGEERVRFNIKKYIAGASYW